MIYLDSNDRLLKVVLGAAHSSAALQITGRYNDITVATMALAAMEAIGAATDGTTPVTVAGSPASGVRRVVTHLSVFNADNIAHTVTVQFSDNSTERPIVSLSLSAGDTLSYVEGTGWGVIDSTGQLKRAGISPNSITNAHLAQMDEGTVKMRVDAGTGNAQDGTLAELKAALDVDNVDNTTDAEKPVSTAQAAADATVLATAEAYADSLVNGLFDLKAAIDCSTNPNYPSASKGDAHVVSAAGKIGGASGTSVDVGDIAIALADNAGGTQASVGSSWTVMEHNLAGALLAANNLSDLADAATARANLGLGTLATQSGTFSGTSSGTNTGDQTTVSGNAGTATALATARTIDGQSFNGSANITVIAPGTNAATSKATPVDADQIPLVDSAASNVLKKLTWANLKTTLQAFFGTLAMQNVGILQPEVTTLTDAASVAWAWSANTAENAAKVTLGGNRTLAISGMVNGQRGVLRVIQDGTGSRTLTLQATSKVAGGGAGAVTLTTTAGAEDMLSFYYTGGEFRVNASLNYT